MDATTAAIVASSIGAGVALLIAFVSINFRIADRLGSLERGYELLREDNQNLREDNRLFREEMRAVMRENSQQLREEMRENSQQLREEMRALIRSESEQTRAEIRRLADALLYHYHDEDGNVSFRIPPHSLSLPDSPSP